MHPSVLVLIITAILGLLGIGAIIAAVFFSANKESSQGGATGMTGMTGQTGICVGPGVRPLISAPSYTRISPKSTCTTPLSTNPPSFPTVSHSVQRSYRLRSIPEPISPNHWLGNAMYGSSNTFLVYPYYGSIENTGFKFGWPGDGVLSENCATSSNNTCPTGFADLSFDVSWGPSIKLGNFSEEPLSCDIVDVDALVGNIVWQYRNIATLATGSISIPLAKGCPFITAEVYRSGVTLECNFNFNVSHSEDQKSDIYQLEIDDTSGYLIFLDKPLTLYRYENVVYFSLFTGVMRIAYYNNAEMITVLSDNYAIYPIESTIGATAAPAPDNKLYNVDTNFIWTTASMCDGCTGDRLLMAALPHHNIINIFSESSLFSHPVIGRYKLVTTTNNSDEWILADAVANFPISYPIVGTGAEKDLFIQTWNNEIVNINSIPPIGTVNWCKWIGSLAMMILIGDMLNQDTSSAKLNLINELSLILSNNGAITDSNILVYDKTWGGVIGEIGINDCSGISDDGNAFYNAHINQYGYLIFAYAVAGYYNPSFIEFNRAVILNFVRDVVNPCADDPNFPLWRNKDWYFGYSLSSGLAPNQSRGKETTDIGEAVFGYYGAYLLSTMLSNQSDLTTWSLAMLASEIVSLQYYFLFTSQSAIEVNYNFVQGTITNRGDTYYAYTVAGGNQFFPQRNASIMVPLLKPMSLISFDYLNFNWTQFVYPWMVSALQNGISSLDPESLATALAILGTENKPPYTRSTILTTINSQSGIYLPYGSTWSSIFYWILALSK
jgi:endoglucanase Acf2